MRSAWALATLAFMLVVAGGADARKGSDGGDDASVLEQAPPEIFVSDPLPEPVDPAPASTTSSALATAALAAPATGGLLAVAVVGGTLLGAAAWIARRSRAPRSSKPRRRTFEHGRRLGRLAGAQDEAAAREALASAPVGNLDHFTARPGEVEAVIVRKKSQPCAQAAGYLSGLYEGAWADEVAVEHPECAGEKGGACRYVVRRAARGANGSGSRAEAAPTRGSATVLGRSLPARPGGG